MPNPGSMYVLNVDFQWTVQWTDWLHWSGCSVTFGSGQMARVRLGLDPRTANRDKDCEFPE